MKPLVLATLRVSKLAVINPALPPPKPGEQQVQAKVERREVTCLADLGVLAKELQSGEVMLPPQTGVTFLDILQWIYSNVEDEAPSDTEPEEVKENLE